MLMRHFDNQWITLMIDGRLVHVMKYPVTNIEYLEFINTNDILQDEIARLKLGYYKRLNVFNLDCHFEFVNNQILLKKSYENYPVCNISHYAAEEYSYYMQSSLLSCSVWKSLLAIDKNAFIDAYNFNKLNVKDYLGHVTNVGEGFVGPSGLSDLIGNVRYWGEAVSNETANCYGLSFNKALSQVSDLFISERMKLLGSMSVSMRLLRY